MKLSKALILLLLTMTPNLVWAQEVMSPIPSLTLFTEDNPPHSFINPQTGGFEGTSVEIMRSLMHEAGVGFTLRILPWNRAFRRAQAEKNTCMFPTNRTPSREKMFQWVSPTQIGGWAIYQRPDADFQINQLEDMSAFSVVGKVGSPASREIEKRLGKSVMRAADDEAAAHLLFRGRADLWIAGKFNGSNAARAAGLPEPKLALMWKPAIFGIACSLSTDEYLITRLNVANQNRIAKLEASENTKPHNKDQHYSDK